MSKKKKINWKELFLDAFAPRTVFLCLFDNAADKIVSNEGRKILDNLQEDYFWDDKTNTIYKK